MKKYMSKVLSLHQPAKIMTGNLSQGKKEISMDMLQTRLNLDQIQQQGNKEITMASLDQIMLDLDQIQLQDIKLAIKDLEMQHYWEVMLAETECQSFPKFCKILGQDPKEGPGSHEEFNHEEFSHEECFWHYENWM
ncbi:hypothetical protein Salat_2716200 [Sesamum alatum]|uniref:Uncharacterized protein n=1 Tax=Sesamum alatum TaxID=300844 RepID=A0AAE2CBH9_9LAMI|nr:hypothetical protein Salat_2716200 [Sesamum alatum]